MGASNSAEVFAEEELTHLGYKKVDKRCIDKLTNVRNYVHAFYRNFIIEANGFYQERNCSVGLIFLIFLISKNINIHVKQNISDCFENPDILLILHRNSILVNN